jgi:uridine kinase
MYYFLVSGKLRNYSNNLRAYLVLLSKLTSLKVVLYSSDEYTSDATLDETVICDISCTIFYDHLSQREMNTIYQWYNLFSCFKLLDNINITSDDIIIRIRPDINIMLTPNDFIEYLEVAATFNGITIPSGNDIYDPNIKLLRGHTLNDQIAIGKYIYMKTYCSLFTDTDFTNKKLPLVSEHMLNEYLIYSKVPIQRVHLPYALCARKCNVLSITGDSGVGKTTLVNSLKSLFPKSSTVLETDRYHKWNRGSSNWLSFTHLNPSANYLEKLLDDTYLLRLGENVYQVDYNHSTGLFTDRNVIEPADNILICGLHTLLSVEQRELIDIKIFIDVEPTLKQKWKIDRDIKKRGYTLERALEIYRLRQKDYYTFIQPQKQYADIIVNYGNIGQLTCTLDIKSDYHQDVYIFLTGVSSNVTSTEFGYSYVLLDIPNEEILHKLPTKYHLDIIDSSYQGIIQCVVYIIVALKPTN